MMSEWIQHRLKASSFELLPRTVKALWLCLGSQNVIIQMIDGQEKTWIITWVDRLMNESGFIQFL